MLLNFIKISTFFFLFNVCNLLAQTNTNTIILTNSKPQYFSIFPAVGYLPESGFLGAISLMIYFNPVRSLTDYPSSLSILIAASVRKQITLNIDPTIYFLNNKILLKGTSAFLLWPARFYGIGPNSYQKNGEMYNAKGALWDGGIQYKPFKNFSIGPSLRIGYENIQSDKNSLLRKSGVAGSYGGFFFGVGGIFSYDTRDKIFWPKNGVLINYRFLSDSPKWKSSYSFNDHRFDARYYFNVFKNLIIGLQTEAKWQTGKPYFRYMTSSNIRALEEGRYRDRFLIQFRNEIRFPLVWRFYGTGFIDYSNMADSPINLQFKYFKTSIGTGLRFALNPKEMVNLRLDIAYVNKGINIEFLALEKF